MCLVFGVAQGWWNIAGMLVEIAGFVVLFGATVHDTFTRNRRTLIGGTQEESLARGMPEQTKMSAVTAANRRDLRSLAAGAVLVIVGLGLQVPGNWPITC